MVSEICDRLDRTINWAGATSAEVGLADLRELIDANRALLAERDRLRAAIEDALADLDGDPNRKDLIAKLAAAID